jgi:hypothetical protein
MRLLGGRTPELALLALRLVLAGRQANDDAVRALRAIVERIRTGGDEAGAARKDYARLLCFVQ